MNKNLYRLVFNQARSLFMAVAENTSAQGKGDASANGAGSSRQRAINDQYAKLRLLSFAAKIAVGALTVVMPLANAQIIADRNAPGNQRPTVLTTANGLPQVNIQTPSAAGVSRNTYRQFDVQSNGAVLNNSRTNTQTQTGGWVQANPWLAGGGARVILNEVNSSNPSQLRGYIEVAGQRAEVIIANPAGIQVNGGGFINAGRVTLVTGTAVTNPANGGSLDGYRVQHGIVNVDGLGLDTGTASYTDILARAVEVNAGIWANRLTVVTGSNEISTSALGSGAPVTAPIAGTGPIPAFTLDVAALGGMYANHIYLVGTEAGLGIRNAGIIGAANGDLVLRADGFLTNRGAIQAASIGGAAGNVQIDTTGAIINNGTDAVISAQGNATVSAGAGLINTAGATLTATGTLNATATQDIQNDQSIIAAHGALALEAANVSNASGVIASVGGDLSIRTSGMTTNTIAIGALDGGLISALGEVNLRNAGLTNTGDSSVASSIIGNHVVIDTALQGLNNANGTIASTGGIHIDSGALNNLAGLIQTAGGDVTVTSSGSIDNTVGRIGAANALVVQDANALKTLVVVNTGGTVIAGQNLTVDAASVTGDGQLLALQDLTLALTSDFDNSGTVIASRDASVTTTGGIANSGQLQAGRSLIVAAQDIDNSVSGEINAVNTSVIAADTLTNRGLMDGIETRLDAVTLTNIGTGRIYGDHIGIAATTLTNDTETVGGVRADAVIATRERLDIGAKTLNNRAHALIFSAGTGDNALNIGGNLDANGHAIGQADIVNNNSATIESLGGLNIATAQLNNTNEHFTTVIEQVVDPVRLMYIQPRGSATKLLAENFIWSRWSRAGLYRYRTSPPPNDSGILGASPVPRVGEQDCVGDDEESEVCTRLPGADYLNGDPAWAYFGVTEPVAAPEQPVLAAPVAPDIAGVGACVKGAGFDASACTTYTTALDVFTTAQTAYVGAWDAYDIARNAWEIDTDLKYIALDERIETYNEGFDGARIKAWTQFVVTHTESESKVATSDPGQILSGGAMHLTGGDLVNDKSRIIAGDALTGDLANLRNVEGEGVYVIHEAGTSQYSYSKWRGGFKRYHQRKWDDAIAYRPADEVTTITLAVTEQREGIAPASTGTQVDALAAIGTNTSIDAAGSDVLTINGPGSLPTNSLFQQNPDPGVRYLIETDPRFTSMRQWLGSDYMLSGLGSDPATVQKRLGDGFQEQKSIREQVAQLTGRRFLDGYASDEAQYQALMDAGITYAKQWNLIPGIALSALQMAQLTSDIVWLVSQEITLADGTRQTVLVPQVYLQVRDGDIKTDGTLIAAAAVNLNLSGDLINSGTVAGRTVTQLTAQNINNLGGRIVGDSVTAKARDDLNNIGGQITAASSLTAIAGRDLNVVSTTRSGSEVAGLSRFSRTNIDRVAGLYITAGASDGSSNRSSTMASETASQNSLITAAGRDVNITAGVIANNAQDGATIIHAGNDVNLGTVWTAVQESNIRNTTNYLKQGNTQDVGSQITGSGSIAMQAGQDINATAATVNASGALTVNAARDVKLMAGEQSSNISEGRQHKSSGFAGSTTRTSRTGNEQAGVIGSSLGGETVAVQSGRDIVIKGSSVIADHDLTLAAVDNIAIEAVQTTHTSSSFKGTKKSGLFTSGLSVTYGTQQKSADQENVQTMAASSTVASVGGNVALTAGNQYRQVGSDVIAPGGDIDITAKKVDIVEARETSSSTSEQKFKQSGITLAITSPVISAMQTVQQMAQAASRTKDGRMQALAGATAALSAKGAYDALQRGQGTEIDGKQNQIATKDADGNPSSRDANAADQVGGINIAISIGASSSQSKTTQTGSSAAGSSVIAGGDVNIAATGAGKDSDATIQGSNIAGRDVIIKADDAIKLAAAVNTDEQHSNNKSSSGSIGISFGTSGFLVTASASQGRGNADGSDVAWTNTHVNATNQLTLQSGGDVQLIGAVASGKQVTADIGGDLTIESLQDTSTYDSKQKDIGGSLSVGVGVWSGSVNFSKSKANSDFASVTEQSGIKAGDEGFNVNVAGNADLKGAVIASSDQAVEDNKNALTTETLTTSSIQNSAKASASSSGISLSTDMASQGKYGLAKAAIGTALNNGGDSGSSAGTSYSAVSEGAVVITDSDKQKALTGKNADETIASLNRDTENAQNGAQRLDVEAMLKTAEAERAIKQEAIKVFTALSDKAYTVMFKEAPKFYKVTCPAGANCVTNPELAETTPASADEMRRVSDQEKVFAVNGILNPLERAGELAMQNTENINKTPANPDGEKPSGIYLMHYVPADNAISELMVAFYEKSMASAFGYTNQDYAYADVIETNGDQSVTSLGHSRGTLVQINANEILAEQGFANPNLSVRGVGGADTAQNFTDAAVKVTGEKAKDNITFNYFSTDPVSVVAGGNSGILSLSEFYRVVMTSNSAHSCYGTGAAGCAQVEILTQNGPKNAVQSNDGLIRFKGGKQVDAYGHPITTSK